MAGEVEWVEPRKASGGAAPRTGLVTHPLMHAGTPSSCPSTTAAWLRCYPSSPSSSGRARPSQSPLVSAPGAWAWHEASWWRWGLWQGAKARLQLWGGRQGGRPHIRGMWWAEHTHGCGWQGGRRHIRGCGWQGTPMDVVWRRDSSTSVVCGWQSTPMDVVWRRDSSTFMDVVGRASVDVVGRAHPWMWSGEGTAAHQWYVVGRAHPWMWSGEGAAAHPWYVLAEYTHGCGWRKKQ